MAEIISGDALNKRRWAKKRSQKSWRLDKKKRFDISTKDKILWVWKAEKIRLIKIKNKLVE